MKKSSIFVIMVLLLIGCTNLNQQTEKDNMNTEKAHQNFQINWEDHEKLRELGEEQLNKFMFENLLEAPDVQQKTPLTASIRIYFCFRSASGTREQSVAFDFEKKEGFMHTSNALIDITSVLDGPHFTLTDQDIQDLRAIFEKHQVQDWDKEYRHFSEGYAEKDKENPMVTAAHTNYWQLYILFMNDTKETHSGKGDTPAIYPENFDAIREELLEFAKGKMEES